MGTSPFLSSYTLPSPSNVFKSYGELFSQNELVKNTFRSLGLNLSGYAKALAMTLPIGFIIGLYPLFRGMFQRFIDAIRFIPLTAVTSIFIVWFGISTSMKSAFLAFGIFIFMLPIIVQRIDEVKDVYLKTVYTIGAGDWQTIRTVYFPSVFSRFFDDIRVLTAISWTYIVVAEGINSGEGGLGALLFSAGQRQGRIDKVFAILILIILIGVLQDRAFRYLDKEFFPHKYQIKGKYQKEVKESVAEKMLSFAASILLWIVIGFYILFIINEFTSWLTDVKVISYLFGTTAWVVHLIFISMILYKGSKLIKKLKLKKPKVASNVQ